MVVVMYPRPSGEKSGRAMAANARSLGLMVVAANADFSSFTMWCHSQRAARRRWTIRSYDVARTMRMRGASTSVSYFCGNGRSAMNSVRPEFIIGTIVVPFVRRNFVLTEGPGPVGHANLIDLADSGWPG
jgi:hypothetical protein